jgi:hypothetical protein
MDIVVQSVRVRQAAVLALVVGLTLLAVLLLIEGGRGAIPSAPRITAVPHTGDATDVFAFDGGHSFECAMDAVRFAACQSPASYGSLPLGRHVFMVRGVSGDGTSGDLAVVQWAVLPGQRVLTGPPLVSRSASGTARAAGGSGLSFSISGELRGLLSPGRGGAVRLRIQNPYPFPIGATALRVTVDPGSTKPGCDSRSDLAVRQSNTARGSVVVVVPAHATVTLPAQGATAPRVWMRNRPVNQDACKGARFKLRYGGIARQVASG